MKRNFKLLAIFVLTVTLIFIGCNNEEDGVSKEDPKLKAFINSTEYKSLDKTLINLGEELKSAYSLLDDEELEEVMDILNNINTMNLSDQQIETSFAKFSQITKVDINSFIDKLQKQSQAVNLYRENNNISNQEFSLAIHKYNNSPRLKSGSEGPNYTCIAACSAAAAACAALGVTLPLCTAAYAACLLSC